MAYSIQKITEQDLQDIAGFYTRLYPNDPSSRKDYEELKWLLSDPFGPGEYRGFIARKESGEIAGIIGYTISVYQFGEKKATGVIPMSWLVSPEARGILGIQLFLKAIKMGDFGFGIHGSEDAIRTYDAVKLKLVARANVYTKITNPARYILSNNPLSLKTWLKGLYFYGGKRKPAEQDKLTLSPYEGETGSKQSKGKDLAMIPTSERNDWFRRCPISDSMLFTLKKDGSVLGTCICIMEHKDHKTRRGKIVQLPYLGNDVKAYAITLALLEEELRLKGYNYISVLANHSALQKALKNRAFNISDRKEGTKVFVRDPEGVLSETDFSEWFLTYYESDKGYRII